MWYLWLSYAATLPNDDSFLIKCWTLSPSMATKRHYSCNHLKVCTAESTSIFEKPDSFGWLKAFDPSRTYPGASYNLLPSSSSLVLPALCPKAPGMYRQTHYDSPQRDTRPRSLTPVLPRCSTVPTLPLLTIEEQDPPPDGHSYPSSKHTKENPEGAVIEDPSCTGVSERLSWPTRPRLPPRRQTVPMFRKTRRVRFLSGTTDNQDSFEGQYEKAFHVTFVLTHQEAEAGDRVRADHTRGCRFY